MNTIVSKALTIAATSAAAAGAKRATEIGWQRVTGNPPPTAADVDDDRDLRDLVIWVAVVTIAVSVARKIARSGSERLT